MVVVLPMFQIDVLKSKDFIFLLIIIMILIKLTFDGPLSVVARLIFCVVSLGFTATDFDASGIRFVLLERLCLISLIFSFFISVI
jgi:hypothetical protein